MGFETVVRPAILPNIRPQPARTLRIEDAPDKGLAVITGGSLSGIVSLSNSESHSWTRQRMVEVKRWFDKVKVFAHFEDGTINRDSWFEVEVLTRIEYLENGKETIGQTFAPFQNAKDAEIMERDVVRENR